MGYRIENKPVSADEMKHLTKIAVGKSGDVYRYRNFAIKVFRDGEKTPIDEDTARYLTDISTDRVLLPKKLIFYNNSFRGYSMKLVSQRGASKKIINTDKGELLSSISYLENDIDELSQKRVLLNGISPDNSMFNGELYFTDPSKYTVLDLDDTHELSVLNKYQLHLLLVGLISSELRRSNYTQSQIKHIEEIFTLKDNEENSTTFMNDVMGKEKTIKQLVKKISS